ncbi:hypothetical protein [Kitasatospora sp. NPDC088548]|uniref:hypothetical protein n=1 Tax=Kitasatospora sp. NPDC088548 TaxID=3364075 RepID=UPI0037F6FA70
MAPETDTTPPPTTRHSAQLGVAADLLEVRGGLDGLFADALHDLVNCAPCGGTGGGTVTFRSTTEPTFGFVTAFAELSCSDPRCLAAVAADRLAARVRSTAPGPERLRALIDMITPHTTLVAGPEPTEVTHIHESGIRAELTDGEAELAMEARAEMADEYPWHGGDAEPPVTVTDGGRGYLTVRAELRCSDPRCLVLLPAMETFNELAMVIDQARQYRKDLPEAVRAHLDEAYRLLLPPRWLSEDGPLPLEQTPQAGQLRTVWRARERSVRAELLACTQALEVGAVAAEQPTGDRPES